MNALEIDFPNVVAEAKNACADYLDRQLALYDERQDRRQTDGMSVLDFTGHGRSGKDTAAQFFAELRPEYKYGGATSNAVCPLIASALGVSEEECFATRHDNRPFWKAFCDEVRRTDHSLLCRLSLGTGDILVGTRGWLELKSAMDEGVIDITVWINRNGIPLDPTMDYDAGDIQTLPEWRWIDNNGTLDDLRRKVSNLVKFV